MCPPEKTTAALSAAEGDLARRRAFGTSCSAVGRRPMELVPRRKGGLTRCDSGPPTTWAGKPSLTRCRCAGENRGPVAKLVGAVNLKGVPSIVDAKYQGIM